MRLKRSHFNIIIARTTVDLLLILSFVFMGCKNSENDRVQHFLIDLSQNPSNEIGKSVFEFEKLSDRSQTLLIEVLSPFRAPSSDQSPLIDSIERSGRILLVKVRLPWNENQIKPILLIEEDTSFEIVGFITAFGDLIPYLNNEDDVHIGILSERWALEQFSKMPQNNR